MSALFCAHAYTNVQNVFLDEAFSDQTEDFFLFPWRLIDLQLRLKFNPLTFSLIQLLRGF